MISKLMLLAMTIGVLAAFARSGHGFRRELVGGLLTG